MTPDNEPLAVVFANTRPSESDDYLAAVKEWSSPWPVLASLAGRLSERDIAALTEQRDAAQGVLHALSDRKTPPGDKWRKAAQPGLSNDGTSFRWVSPPPTLRWSGRPSLGVSHLLGRAVVDFSFSPELRLLRRCAGKDCRTVFIYHRSRGSWCGGKACDNQPARVRTRAG